MNRHLAGFVVLLTANTAFAQESKPSVKETGGSVSKPAAVDASKTEDASKTGSETKGATSGDKKEVAKGAKPESSPGWIVLEEDWWVPFHKDPLGSLQNAQSRYRAREANAAAAEIDKAASWLRIAQSHSTKGTIPELATARADLEDFATLLRSGKPVEAKRLDAAFAHASAALSKYHHFKAKESFARDELKAAGEHLVHAAEDLRFAAQSANLQYGDEIVSIFNDYAPNGYMSENITIEPSKLGKDLSSIENELSKLGERLKTGR